MGKLFLIDLVNIEKNDQNIYCKIITDKMLEMQKNIYVYYKCRKFLVFKDEKIFKNEWINESVLIKSYSISEMYKYFLNTEQKEQFDNKYNLCLQHNYKQELIDFIEEIIVISKLEGIDIICNEDFETNFDGRYFIAIKNNYRYKYYYRYLRFSDIVTEKQFNDCKKFFLNCIEKHKKK